MQSDIVEGLQVKLKNLKAVSALEKGNSIPLFISWTTEHSCTVKNNNFITNMLDTHKFFFTGKIIGNILRAYQKEQYLHQKLLPRIADCMDPDSLLFYLSCWTYQPYLDHSIEKQLNCMIKETRHT